MVQILYKLEKEMEPWISRSLPSLDRSSRLSLGALKLVTRVFFFKWVTLDYAKCNSQFWSFLYMYKLGEVSSNCRIFVVGIFHFLINLHHNYNCFNFYDFTGDSFLAHAFFKWKETQERYHTFLEQEISVIKSAFDFTCLKKGKKCFHLH